MNPNRRSTSNDLRDTFNAPSGEGQFRPSCSSVRQLGFYEAMAEAEDHLLAFIGGGVELPRGIVEALPPPLVASVRDSDVDGAFFDLALRLRARGEETQLNQQGGQLAIERVAEHHGLIFVEYFIFCKSA